MELNFLRQGNKNITIQKKITTFIFIVSSIFSFIKIRGFDIFIYIKQAEFESFLNPLSKNLFSFSYPEYSYKNYSLLFSELVAILNYYFGLNSLIMFQSLIVGLSFTLLFLAFSKEFERRKQIDNYFIVAFALLLAIFTLRYRLLFRPHNMTYLFFALNIFFLIRQPRYYLYLLFINQLLWVNSHNGFILGIVNLFFLLFYKGELKKDFSKIFTVLVAGSLCSRFGWRPFLEVINPFVGETKDIFQIIKIHEWQPTDERLYFSFYGGLILFSFLYIIYRRNFKILPFYLFYLLLSMRFVRFVDFFALTAFFSVIAYKNETRYLEKRRTLFFSIKALSLIGLFTICLSDFISNPTIPYGYGVADFFYPEGAVTFIKKHKIKGTVFNSYPYGGYLIYKLYPDCKPIIDGRLCYPLDFIKLYAESHEEANSFVKIIDHYKPDIFLVDFDHPKLNYLLDISREKYALVYFDDNALIFLKRGVYSDIVSSREFKYLRPIYVSGYSESDVNIAALKNELEMTLANAPTNRGIVMYANILLQEGKTKEAKSLFQKVVKSNTPIGKIESYNNLGTIMLYEDNVKEAKKFFKKALSLKNEFEMSHLNLARVYDEEGNYSLAFYHYKKFIKFTGGKVDSEILERVQILKKLTIIFIFRVLFGVLACLGILFILLRKKINIRKF